MPSAYVVFSVHPSSLIVYTFLSQFARVPDDSSDVLNGSRSKEKSVRPHSVFSDHVCAQFHRLSDGFVNPQFSAACAHKQVVVGTTIQSFVGSFAVPKQVILLEIPEVEITVLQ